MSTTEIVEKYHPNFEGWIQEFQEWQTRIGFDPAWLGDYRFEIRFDWDSAGNEIEFGDFTGMPKWKRRMQIPQQNNIDEVDKYIHLIRLIVHLLNIIHLSYHHHHHY